MDVKYKYLAYRCPLMSDWSQMPPSDIRWKLRPIVLAMERPMLVLPTPGGPTKQSIGPVHSNHNITYSILCVHTSVYMCVCLFICLCVHLYAWVHACMVYTHTHMCLYMYACTCMLMYVFACACLLACVLCVLHVCTYTTMYMCMHVITEVVRYDT